MKVLTLTTRTPNQTMKLTTLVFTSLFLFLCSITLSVASAFAEAATLNIKMSPLNNTDGNLVYALYNSEESYQLKSGEFQKDTVRVVDAKGPDGAAHIKITALPPGFYAFTVFHDENENGELDTSWLGKPKEMFGISNIERTLWSEPKWDEVRFEIKPDENKDLPITLKYQ